jgi:hypothetical protein
LRKKNTSFGPFDVEPCVVVVEEAEEVELDELTCV